MGCSTLLKREDLMTITTAVLKRIAPHARARIIEPAAAPTSSKTKG
jgi:hypothetical protein